jgi:hypothetical protein
LHGFAAKVKKLSAPPTVVVWRSPQLIEELKKEEALKKRKEAEKAQQAIQAKAQSNAQTHHQAHQRRSSIVDEVTNAANLTALCNMGFKTARAQYALRKSMGNLEYALESLLTDTDGYSDRESISSPISSPALSSVSSPVNRPTPSPLSPSASSSSAGAGTAANNDNLDEGVSFIVDLTGPIGVSFKAPRGSLGRTSSSGGMV